jgi:hypothetical protein
MDAQSPNDEKTSNRMKKEVAVGRARFVNSWIVAHSHVAAAETTDKNVGAGGRTPSFGHTPSPRILPRQAIWRANA